MGDSVVVGCCYLLFVFFCHWPCCAVVFGIGVAVVVSGGVVVVCSGCIVIFQLFICSMYRQFPVNYSIIESFLLPLSMAFHCANVLNPDNRC